MPTQSHEETTHGAAMADEARPMALTVFPNGTAQIELGDEKPWLLSAAELASLRALLALPSAKRGPL